MNQIDKEMEKKMEGLIVRAIQSGKKETSGLVEDFRRRLEEFTSDTNVSVNELKLSVDRLTYRLESVKDTVGDIKQKVNSDYVSHMEFEPVKKVVYGLVSLILISVVGASIALVIKQ